MSRLILALLACAAVGCSAEGGPLDGSVLLDGIGPGPLDLSVGGGTGPCDTFPTTIADSQQRARCGLGTDAAAFIRKAPYSRVVVEVAATTGAAPSAAALDHLKSVILDVCDKPGGVSIVMGDQNIPSPGHPLTIDDARALEDAHRKQFSLGDTAVFFYLVVSDPSSDDGGGYKTLGIAHRASSMVVFQGSIRSVSGGLGQPSSDTVESAVVAHEYGHVLGLVNIATPMVTPHQDTAHGAHDSNDQCLMYYLNNSSAGLAGNLLTGGVIADFDAQCRADLMAVRNAM